MGQRHQLFVIARIGKYYRGLAAIHHQWLYGMSALRACHRLRRVFSDPSNRLALKHELDLAAAFFENQPPPPSKPAEYEPADRSTCPFPFILTCLAVGTGYDLDLGQVYVIHELRYDTGYDQGDNNDGITVLDITNLDRIRYCFVNLGCEDDSDEGQIDGETQSEVGLPNTETPLTGRAYLRGYYVDSDEMVTNTDVIEALDKAPLIDKVALAVTWPWGHWGDETKAQAAQLIETHDSNPTKSLRDMAAAKLFERLLESTDDEFDPSILDQIRDIPGFQKMVKRYLLSHAEKVGPSQASAYLLQLAYDGEDVLEWNLFIELDPKSIKSVLASDALKGATGISLTTPRNRKPAELLEALSSLKLHTLQVLDWPDRLDDQESNELFEALAKTNSQLALQKLTLTGPYSSGIRQSIWRRYRTRPKTSEAFPVVQLLVSNAGNGSSFLASTGMQLESFYLGDAPLTPAGFIRGLFRYLTSQVTELRSYDGTGLQCAYCFSCGPSTLGESESPEVAPLPAEVYTIAKGSYHSSAYQGIQSKMRDLTPNTWTAIVGKTIDTVSAGTASPTTTRMQLKYALVRSKAEIEVGPERWRGSDIQPAEVEVVDMDEFLCRTAPEVDTSKLAYHVSNLENTLGQVSFRQTEVTTPDGEPLLSVFSPEEACAALNKAVAAVPQVQKAVTRSSKWRRGDGWVARLGFDNGERAIDDF